MRHSGKFSLNIFVWLKNTDIKKNKDIIMHQKSAVKISQSSMSLKMSTVNVAKCVKKDEPPGRSKLAFQKSCL